MSRTEAFVAATRFGLGPRPGELRVIARKGPSAWLFAQLDGPDPKTTAALGQLPPTSAHVARQAEARGASQEARKMARQEAREAFKREQAAHLSASASSDRPFRERLVAFWANHFTVSTLRGGLVGVVSGFEREVIRGNLDGRFAQMLLASTRHPAMLGYLDNLRSIGPTSKAGQRSGRGLNENLAREVLELHTLGVGGGYDQGDVVALAELLTGWTLAGARRSESQMRMDHEGATGQFEFDERRHEPGSKRLLGVRYGGRGYDDGVAALDALAQHPATARHVARKLVRHFVSDSPSTADVAALAKAFTDSGGHLPTVHRALAQLPSAYEEPLGKVKTPWDLVLSTARALGQSAQGTAMLAALRFLGQLPFQAPSPQGWPDTSDAWLGPEAILSRLDWANQVARTTEVADAGGLAKDLLGPVLTAASERAIAAERGRKAVAMLLACPEFQRR
ncbi:MAG: DUF1800 domain-containing protein [Myxococcales bacterium]|nr:DUF1800 domain-containing protein [Myxococcales bacterium]